MLVPELPNLFDQYSQYENRVTNALLQTFASSHRLTRTFLADCVGMRCRAHDVLEMSTQKRPGGKGDRGEGEGASRQDEGKTVPDGWIVNDRAGWVVVIESKIAVRAVRADQLLGHLRAARGYGERHLLVLTPDRQEPPEIHTLRRRFPHLRWLPWTVVHGWIVRQARRERRGSATRLLLRNLKEYLEMDERLSDFQGIDFSEGYDLRRAKAILKILMDALRPDVQRLYPKLTGGRGNLFASRGAMWDCFGVVPKFTGDLHLTLSIGPQEFQVGLVVPNAARARWTHLRKVVSDATQQARLKAALKQVHQSVPELWLRLDQRHFLNRREQIFDATCEFKLDTATFVRPKGNVKPFPLWFEMAREAIITKRGINLQIGFWARFPYAQVRGTQSAAFKDTILDTLKQFRPLYQMLRMA